MTSSGRVVIVGGGVLGTALAAELRRRGLGVVLLEKAVPGAEASRAAAGMLAPQAECDEDGPLLELALFSNRATHALADVVREETGVDVALDRQGLVDAAFDDGDAAKLRARVAWQTRRGLRAEVLAPQDARRLLPALSTAIVEAAVFPDDHRLDTHAYADGLAALARARGAEVVQGAIVQGIVVEGGRARRVRVAQDGAARAIEGDAVVVCAGAWSAHVEGAGLSLDDVFPVRGQIVLLQGPPGLFDRALWGAGGYVVPRRDGRVLCGSTMERVGFDKAVTAGGVRRVLDGALRLVPALADAPILSTWSGLRPGTRDGLPVLGAAGVDGLFLNTGHFRNGVLLAAGSAVVVADQIEGRAPAIETAPFSPRRFAR